MLGVVLSLATLMRDKSPGEPAVQVQLIAQVVLRPGLNETVRRTL